MSFKNLKNIIKPEFQHLYKLRKANNNFHIDFYRDKTHQDPYNVLTFVNPNDPIKIYKDGDMPYISKMPYLFSYNIYKHLNISSDVRDIIEYIFTRNNSKNDFYLFFKNTFSETSRSLKKTTYAYTTKVVVKISEQMSEILFFKIDIIKDIKFSIEPVKFDDENLTSNSNLIQNIKPYLVLESLFIDIKNKKVFKEDENGNIVDLIEFNDYVKNDKFNIHDIKQRATDIFVNKIKDIDNFKWS